MEDTMSVTFKIGGKEVPHGQFGEKLKEAAIDSVKEQLRTKIEAARCPVHNQHAKAVIESGAGLKYEITGCCEAFIEEVKKSLGVQA
jgi:hypothetical protein